MVKYTEEIKQKAKTLNSDGKSLEYIVKELAGPSKIAVKRWLFGKKKSTPEKTPETTKTTETKTEDNGKELSK